MSCFGALSLRMHLYALAGVQNVARNELVDERLRSLMPPLVSFKKLSSFREQISGVCWKYVMIVVVLDIRYIVFKRWCNELRAIPKLKFTITPSTSEVT